MTTIIGWDIGGAHVKAARAEAGRLTAIAQIACASHEGIAHLEGAICKALGELGPAPHHRVTMTAELSDAFENRASGVVSIAAILAHAAPGAALSFYAGARGFAPRADVAQQADLIASANWRAAAELVAQQRREAIFIDFGSTTTDIIPIRGHRVIAQGGGDAARLAEGELAYAGFSRGAPQAYARFAPLDGRWQPLVNEAFATMADVRRVMGDLDEGDSPGDLAPTADGRAKSVAASRARLARLAGRDDADWSEAQALAFAAYLARAQWRLIEDQFALVASRVPAAAEAPIVGAGVGRARVARWAQAQGVAYADFADFIDAPAQLQQRAADCAPAAALALIR